MHGETVLLYVREGDDAGHVWDTMQETPGVLLIIRELSLEQQSMLYEKYGTQQYYDDACNVMANTVQ